MNWTQLYLNTFIPQLPRLINSNFQSFQRYLDIFYDGSNGIVTVPVETAGRVKGTRGEFVTVVADQIVVRKQLTNILQNVTTADADYYNAFVQGPVTERIADPSSFENQAFKYVDVIQPYYKIDNDTSVAFLSNNLGQQFQMLFDVSTSGSSFNILMDPSTTSYVNGYSTLNITASDSSAAWFVLIAVDFDASWGTTWAIKQYGGNYNII